MTRFRFAALDPDGKVSRGVADAADERALAAHIQARGLWLLRAAPDSFTGSLLDVFAADLGRTRGLSANQIAELTRELAILLGAGQTLDQALRLLLQETRDKRLEAVLQRIRERVRGGDPLSSALATEPGSFDRLYVGLVRAGEAGGKLAEALGQTATLMERQRALAAKITASLTYPILLVIAAIATLALLLLYVLPQFEPIFAQAGARLPWSTAMLIALGDGLSDYGWLLLIGVGGFVLAGAAAFRHPESRASLDRLILRAPVVGGIIREGETARLTRTLGTLLTNGVPLLGALSITRDVLRNMAFVGATEQATAGVKQGQRLSDQLGRAGCLPLRAISLLRLGEESGRLGELALQASDIHEEETRRRLERLVALLVPVITIVMGMMVAGIISSLVLAMISLNDLAV